MTSFPLVVQDQFGNPLNDSAPIVKLEVGRCGLKATSTGVSPDF